MGDNNGDDHHADKSSIKLASECRRVTIIRLEAKMESFCVQRANQLLFLPSWSSFSIIIKLKVLLEVALDDAHD